MPQQPHRHLLLLLYCCFCCLLSTAVAMPPPRQPAAAAAAAASSQDLLLLPADHADAVRLESDAHLNRDFVREILFGEAHDAVRPQSRQEARDILARLFPLVDSNADGSLTVEELAARIAASVAEHEAAARSSSGRVFAALTSSLAGGGGGVRRLSLRDYTIELMTSITGGNRSLAVAFADDSAAYPLSDAQARQLAVNHHRWAQADADADGWLDAGEFVCFQHSELCNATLDARLDDAFAALDKDSDQVITRDEFISLPESSVVEELPFGEELLLQQRQQLQQQEIDRRRREQRAAEFEQRLDANGDGRADRRELRAYMQPDGAIMAAREAALLLRAADGNADGRLSLAEVLDNYGRFIGSKLVNAAAALHEEL